MNEREQIKIFWEGPFKINDILEGNIDKKYDVTSQSQGLYQIYGSHPLYGNGVLVYIGRTKDKNGFQSRLKGRWVIEDGSDSENVQVYLGTVLNDGKKYSDEETSNIIDKSEVLLINAMKPAYNSSNIQSANEDFIDDNFILHNEGNYRNIYPVLDSKYFWQPYQNLAIVNEIAESFNIKLKTLDVYDDEYYGFELNDIDKFKFNNTYIIWFGVSYEEWNESKVSLELQVYSEDKKIMKKIKSLKIDEFKYKKYDDEEENYFQIEFDKVFFELESESLKEAFEIKVNEIISLIKI